MNERINELARKSELAWAEDVGCGFPDIKYPKGYEKFAELIIKETLLVISRTPGLYKAEEVDGMIKCFNHVEKHFGVE